MVQTPSPTSDAYSADAFEAIYTANAPLIYNFMFWRTRDVMLAEDLTSHVFEKAWRMRTSFRGGSVQAWLYKIAGNTLIDHWRKKKEL
ncbi:MAG TPA: RNA polymerase sigma factor, partial [Candidatus Acidoferrum sp.]|nr:RNA polymerase sigma factor [Candidatus Acidoferrum sp.]